MKHIIKNASGTINNYKGTYLALNAAYYGFFIIGMLYTFFDPTPRNALNAANAQLFSSTPLLSSVVRAYSSGSILSAALWTFVANLFIGVFLYITVPSLLHPFIGIGLICYRALCWGLIFSPAPYKPYLPFHWVTLAIEGQAYVIAMLAGYISWQLRKQRRPAYHAGVTVILYTFVIILLAVSAVYEAWEVIKI
jgi:hypothetical protein